MRYLITAITPQKRNPDRVSLYLDGEFAFGLSKIVAAWLKVGDQLDQEKIDILKKKDAYEVGYQKAIHYIEYRSRTEKEIIQKLEKEGFDSTIIDLLIERLKEQKLIEDQSYSFNWVQSRGQFRPRGRRLLAHELRQKGIADEVIQLALAEVDDEQLAVQAANKYARRLENLEYQKFREKLGAYLLRRGFGYSTVSKVIPQIWEKNHLASEKPTSENGDIDHEW